MIFLSSSHLFAGNFINDIRRISFLVTPAGERVNKTSHIIVFSRVWTPFSISLSSRWRTLVLNNGNWTEWIAIWAEIIRVISKLNKRAVQVWFEITSMISDQNTSILKLLKYRTWSVQIYDALLSWCEIKLIRFLVGKSKSFGNKSCKICLDTLYLSFFCNLIGYFKQALKSDWLLVDWLVILAAAPLSFHVLLLV